MNLTKVPKARVLNENGGTEAVQGPDSQVSESNTTVPESADDLARGVISDSCSKTRARAHESEGGRGGRRSGRSGAEEGTKRDDSCCRGESISERIQ